MVAANSGTEEPQRRVAATSAVRCKSGSDAVSALSATERLSAGMHVRMPHSYPYLLPLHPLVLVACKFLHWVSDINMPRTPQASADCTPTQHLCDRLCTGMHGGVRFSVGECKQ